MIVRKRIYNILRMFWTLTRFAEPNLRRKLFLAYIFPHFLYADAVLFGMSKQCEKKLILAFNACVRYVFNLRKYDHILHVSNSLIGCSLMSYYMYRIVVFIYLLIRNRIRQFSGTASMHTPVEHAKFCHISAVLKAVQIFCKFQVTYYPKSAALNPVQ